MKKIGMTWKVKPEHMDEYVDIHLNPWSDLIEGLQSVGVHNYNIFRFGDQMFAYLEVESDDSLAEFQKLPVADRWNAKVLPWVAAEAKEGGDQFMMLDRVFYCE